MPDQSTDLLLSDVQKLEQKLGAATLPPELKEQATGMLERLKRMVGQGFYTEEFERARHYIDWITALPWDQKVDKPVDLKLIEETLYKHHYGMQEVKDRILEYMSVYKLRLAQNKGTAKAPNILLVGLVGTGKTTFAYALSEALGRPIARIPFGGMGSARDLRGQSRLHLEAEPGYIVRALKNTQVKNPIILLDEIDRVTEEVRNDIMGVLVELLDPEQNKAFLDHYIDYPVDLSEVLFIATSNNTTTIATAVLDRLEPIRMPSYSDDEKMHIAKEYLMPKVLKQTGLSAEQLIIDESLWPQIVRPLGYDAGIRTLGRTIEGVARKAARIIVEGNTPSVTITPDNIKDFLPKW